ncbi:rRNA adenine N-6-methyltransferase family protein [Bradyrhizobium sp. ARR65]|uniref:class I SAM-dependent methyltransferase n=1 Tax=Bradyrhizobium sp. ARR65 TaxID=1040989 RepID=UPI000465AED3|nr:rRNA adenine N-6-methyltransferase family protein [Bradyrhizobium sp. ARR65]
MSCDFFSFFLAWLSAPRRVGAIAPSGTALAELITREITAASGPILELGPGTGVFTYQLLKRGIRQQDLTLVEYGSDFMRLLQLRFPGARVLWMDAARLADEPLFDGAPVGAVVSGLPLLNMSTRKVMSIIGGAFSYLRPGGAFYQFTYGMTCPVPRPVLDRLGLRAKLVDRAMFNVPPAAVYRLTRRPQCKLVAQNGEVPRRTVLTSSPSSGPEITQAGSARRPLG